MAKAKPTKRYVKTNGGWIDTDQEYADFGRTYYIEKGQVYYYDNESYGIDHYVGPLLKQKEELENVRK